MRVSIRQPSELQVRRFLAEQSHSDFSYPETGATLGKIPAGYLVDQTRVELGSGEAIFRTACDALREWKQFELGWVKAFSIEQGFARGELVAISGKGAGLWWLNACRIIEVIDDHGPLTRYGFAYGTLPAHAQIGEERFLIEWNRDDDRVHFDILAFSKPGSLLIRCGYPLVRRAQKRFGRDSAKAMYRSVHDNDSNSLIVQTTKGDVDLRWRTRIQQPYDNIEDQKR